MRMPVETTSARRAQVFFVNSFTTFLCALAVSHARGFSPEEVKLVGTRGFRVDSPFKIFDFPFGDGKQFRPGLDVWRKRAALAQLDSFMEEVAGGPYHLYVPKTSSHAFPLLLSSPYCDGFSLIEEGSASYRSKFRTRLGDGYVFSEESLRDAVGRRLKELIYAAPGRMSFGARYRSRRPFYSLDYDTAFCLAEAAFTGFPRREVVDLRRAIEQIAAREDFAGISAGAPLIVFDWSWEDQPGGEARLLGALERLTGRLTTRGAARVYFKRHPRQHALPVRFERVFAALRRTAPEVEFVELPPETSLEALAMYRPDVVFLIDVSSVGIYAKMLGSKVLRYTGERGVPDQAPAALLYPHFDDVDEI